MTLEQHVGGSYRGDDEAAAQQRYGIELVEFSLGRVVRKERDERIAEVGRDLSAIVDEERADRIREQGIEQAQLIGWRQAPPRSRRQKRRAQPATPPAPLPSDLPSDRLMNPWPLLAFATALVVVALAVL